jgi:glyoxylase-like metal-dependent hydrolase (beta-lactamase superfamily II)
MEVVIQGFPGKTLLGSLSWSSVVYVEAGKHKILFDTGGPSKRGRLKQHLGNIGVAPEDITMLILSHFHDDHVRNYDYFPQAEIVMHEKEYEWGRSRPVSSFAFPEVYFEVIQKTRRVSLIRKDEEIAPGVCTLFAPGHTPGSMALVLRVPDMPVTVLAGDAVKNMAELATAAVDMSLDNSLSSASIRAIRDIAEIVVPGHDRILKVEQNAISAVTEAREGVLVPPDVMEPGKKVLLDLVVPITAMPITPCIPNCPCTPN